MGLAYDMAMLDLTMELQRQNERMVKLVTENMDEAERLAEIDRKYDPRTPIYCEVCGNECKTIYAGSKVCSEDCKDKRDGKVEHPTVMPPHKPMGYVRPTDELDGILMDGTEGKVDPGSIR